MTTGQWQRVKELFHEATAIDPARREAVLRERASGDDLVLNEALALLAAHVDDPNPASAPGPKSAAGADGRAVADKAAARLHGLGRSIGPYRLVRVLGEGGMGVVFLAERAEPIRQVVALKLVRAGLESRQALARFDAECQALALMDHPNVAKVFDAGVDEDGRPYFVMEYVPGEPITSFCDGQRLSVRRRLELFAQACDAVSHAHQKAVIHRDLKPGNILVTLVDGKPVVKVIDFGVAKAVGSAAAPALARCTVEGQWVGTPEYMSPEQAGEARGEVDTRTDVYSLGVVLYELLTGCLPLDGAALRRAPAELAQRIIRESDAPRPSTRVCDTPDKGSEVAGRRSCTPRALCALLRRELEWIPMKAVRKRADLRYPSVAALAEDVRRYLRHETISARPAGAVYTLAKFARRQRTVMAASVAVLLSLVAGVVGTGWQAGRATAAEREVRERLRGSLLNEARAERYGARPGRRLNALRALAEAARIRSGDDLRDEAIAALALVDVAPLPTPQPFQDAPGLRPSVVAFDPAMRHYLIGNRDNGDLELRRVVDGSVVWRLPSPGAVAWVAVFSRDGARVAVKYHPIDLNIDAGEVSRVRVWDLATGEPLVDLPELHGHVAFDFTPAGDTLAVGDADGSIAFYDLARGGGLSRRLPPGVPSDCMRFSPDGRHIAVAGLSHKATLEVRDAESGASVMLVPLGHHARAVAWHPDGGTVVVATFDLLLRIFDFPSGQPRAVLKGHTNVPVDVCFSSTGDLLASYGWDEHLRLWDAATGREVLALPNTLMFGDGALRFGPGGDRLAYAGDPRQVRLLALDAGSERLTVPLELTSGNGFRDATVSPDNRWVAAVTDRQVLVFRRAPGAESARLEIEGQRFAVFDQAGDWTADPSGRSLVTWGDGGLRRWPLVPGATPGEIKPGVPRVLAVPPPSNPGGGAVSYDGTLLAVADRGAGTVYLYDLRRDRLLFTASLPSATSVAVDPQGRYLAAVGAVSRLVVWDVGRGEPVYERPFPEDGKLAFSSDGKWLGAGSQDWNVVLRVPSWYAERIEPGRTAGGVALHPRGNVVAFSAGRGLVRLAAASGEKTFATFPGDRPVCFSRDGSLLLTFDGDLRVWDLELIRRQLSDMHLPLDLTGGTTPRLPLPQGNRGG